MPAAGGTAWDEASFAARMAAAREQLELLGRPVKTLAPGEYRVYFSPVAVWNAGATMCSFRYRREAA